MGDLAAGKKGKGAAAQGSTALRLGPVAAALQAGIGLSRYVLGNTSLQHTVHWSDQALHYCRGPRPCLGVPQVKGRHGTVG